MKAVVYDRYGNPDVLKVKDLPKPTPKDNEVLVKVKAASINSWDWDMIRGKPVFVRMWGVWKPRYTIPGADIAGVVEAIGKDVKKFRPGDEVFGDIWESGWGGFAEYKSVNENALTGKPDTMTFEEAAAIPQAGLMALQSVIDKANVKAGQRVLINGAGGGVGTMAIQLAKSLNAEVTAVDSQEKLPMLTKLGADHVIDYSKEDFSLRTDTYDVVIDVVANRSLSEFKRSLRPGGMFIMIGGTTRAILECMLFSRLKSRGDKKLGMLAYQTNRGLDRMIKLFNEGKVVPLIDKIYSLENTADAFRYYAQGNFKGKVIITM